MSIAEKYSVVIVGGGPAGVAAAIHLTQKGVDVLVIERATFPRYKVCGGCLNPAAVGELEALGILDDLRAAGAVPSTSFCLSTAQCTVTIPLAGGLAISREVLDALLLRRASVCGATVVAPALARLREIDSAGEQRWVEFQCHGETRRVAAELVIVAAGLSGQSCTGEADRVELAADSLIGVGCTYEPIAEDSCPSSYRSGEISMSVGPEGYVGVTPVEMGRINVAAALRPDATRSSTPREVSRRLLANTKRPPLLGAPTREWQGTLSLTRRRRQLSEQRMLFIGDAAGYVEPFTGEGIYWALSSGRRAARLVTDTRPANWCDVPWQWDTEHAASMWSSQRSCRWMSRLLRHPRLLSVMLGMLGYCPWLARPVLKSIHHGGTP